MKMFHNKMMVLALLLTGCSLICATEPVGPINATNSDTAINSATGSLSPAFVPPNEPINTASSAPETITKSNNTPAPTTISSTTTAPEPSASSTTTAAPITTPLTTSSTTTAAPITTPLTTSSTTTAAPITTPLTTSSTTTTAAPLTTPPTTSTTTTAAPSTTTAAPAPTPSTPAPKPTPYPEPSIGNWNSSCILVKMATQLNITYLTKDKQNETALYNIPANATVDDSSCENITQTIQINWGNVDAQQSMLLQFDLKNNTSELTMLRFTISIVGDRFPNAMENQTIQLLHRGNDFKAPVQMSYHCTRAQRFNLTETVVEKELKGSVVMRDVQVEAFRKDNNSTFSSVHDCDSSDTPDIVPIAVGIALAAMIMIILTAYLCARRRTAWRGYMSF